MKLVLLAACLNVATPLVTAPGLGPVGSRPRTLNVAPRNVARFANPAAAVTPAIARSQLSTQQERIGALEAELKGLRASVADGKKALAALDATLAPAFRETTSRSLVKAFGWRITAGFITFCSCMYFTGKLKTALAIVASDFVSKSGTMFLGERLFNKVKVGRSGGGETLARSIVKALIWRAVAFVNTALVSGAIIGSAGVGSMIALSDSVFKTTLMVFYDQFWNRIDWGKELENVGGDGI